jgi:hypothetical protein
VRVTRDVEQNVEAVYRKQGTRLWRAVFALAIGVAGSVDIFGGIRGPALHGLAGGSNEVGTNDGVSFFPAYAQPHCWGNTALVTGVLTEESGCLFVGNDAHRMLVIWPYASTPVVAWACHRGRGERGQPWRIRRNQRGIRAVRHRNGDPAAMPGGPLLDGGGLLPIPALTPNIW